MKQLICIFALFSFVQLLPSSSTGLDTAWAAEGNPITAVELVALDGARNARIRRAKGTELVAAKGDKLFPGDSISTDSGTALDLRMADGSITRLGLDSEYKVESIAKEGGFWAWSFDLVKGSVRALVEKSNKKDFVKLRIRTQTGTMGVRGTEFVLSYSPQEEVTDLYTIHGSVWFGPAKASFNNMKQFIVVDKGQSSSIGKGEKIPRTIRPFDFKDLVMKGSEHRRGARGENGEHVAAGSEREHKLVQNKRSLQKADSATEAGTPSPAEAKVDPSKAALFSDPSVPLDDKSILALQDAAKKLIEDSEKGLVGLQSDLNKNSHDKNIVKDDESGTQVAGKKGDLAKKKDDADNFDKPVMDDNYSGSPAAPIQRQRQDVGFGTGNGSGSGYVGSKAGVPAAANKPSGTCAKTVSEFGTTYTVYGPCTSSSGSAAPAGIAAKSGPPADTNITVNPAATVDPALLGQQLNPPPGTDQIVNSGEKITNQTKGSGNNKGEQDRKVGDGGGPTAAQAASEQAQQQQQQQYDYSSQGSDSGGGGGAF